MVQFIKQSTKRNIAKMKTDSLNVAFNRTDKHICNTKALIFRCVFQKWRMGCMLEATPSKRTSENVLPSAYLLS